MHDSNSVIIYSLVPSLQSKDCLQYLADPRSLALIVGWE